MTFLVHCGIFERAMSHRRFSRNYTLSRFDSTFGKLGTKQAKAMNRPYGC
jgi:hypothetical protein